MYCTGFSKEYSTKQIEFYQLLSIVVGAVSRSHFGSSVRPFFVDNTNCGGNESNLLDCPALNSSANGSIQCDHSEEAGVICGGAQWEASGHVHPIVNVYGVEKLPTGFTSVYEVLNFPCLKILLCKYAWLQ